MPDRICHIMYVLNSSDMAGGATIGLLQLLKHLPRHRYRAYLVIPTNPTPNEEAVLKQMAEDIAVVRMGGAWTKSSRPTFRRLLSEMSVNTRTLFHTLPQAQLCWLIKKWNIDLVYTNSIMVADGAVAARLSGRPHIWHVKECIGKGRNTQFYLPDPLLITTINALSSRIVVMTDFIAEPFARYCKMDKISVIYDGVDLELFRNSAKGISLRQHLGIAEDGLLVGMVASLGAFWKQHEVFLRMAALLKDRFPKVQFGHFGPVPNPSTYHGRYHQHLCRLIEELGLTSHFVWAGVVTDIPQMMDALDVLVHPCDTEPFGRVAIEAMAAARPVVGPARGGIAESVVDGQTGFLVEPGNPDAFAKATEHLLVNPRLRHEMGCAGRVRVEAHFSVQQHVTKMVEVFDAVS